MHQLKYALLILYLYKVIVIKSIKEEMLYWLVEVTVKLIEIQSRI